MYLLSEHAILVKVVLRESMLETVLFYRIPMILLSLSEHSDIELNCFQYGHMKMCHMKF